MPTRKDWMLKHCTNWRSRATNTSRNCNYVIIYHGSMSDGNAYSTLYGHMRSVATSAGKYVKQGELIGYVGSTGNSTGNHLHLEVMTERPWPRQTAWCPVSARSSAASSLKRENLIVKRVVPENYELGRIEMKSPSGNPIRVYNLERTLCDILRGSGSDIQIV